MAQSSLLKERLRLFPQVLVEILFHRSNKTYCNQSRVGGLKVCEVIVSFNATASEFEIPATLNPWLNGIAA
jgi:hypothetical protein